MARVVPDVLPARATAGEKRVLEILEGLPEGVLVYYEITVSNRHPDIIIIDPHIGLIVIEVKGWRAGDIKSANREECIITVYGSPQPKLHPLKQSREYMFRLVDEMKLHPQTRQFWSNGKCRIPYLHLAALTSTNRRLLHKNFGSAADEVFPANRVLTQDELEEMKLQPPAGLRDFLRELFDPWFQFHPLSANEMESIRAWLHPEIVLSAEESHSPIRVQESLPGSWENLAPPALKVLDLQQESHACRIGDGHRILSGVAGSGKTSILISRAKLMHDHVKGIKILFLCYNKLLAEHLKSVLGKSRKIDVFNFHKWGADLGVAWFPNINENYWEKQILQAIQALPEDQRYDLVLVDEAQDFQPNWLMAARLALKDPDEGDLLLAGDGCQNLYRKKFTWSSVGIKASGRVIGEKFNLHRNYRNSREIVTLAKEVMVDFLKENAGEDSGVASFVGEPSISPRQTLLLPVLWKCPDREAECGAAVRLILMLLSGEWPEGKKSGPLKSEEIAILYPKQVDEKLIERLMLTLDAEKIPNSWLSQRRNGKSYSNNKPSSNGVKIQTIHSAKGLQYRAVIIIWADSLSTMNMDNEGEAQLLYVACTRAEDYLGILHSKDTVLLDRLKGAALVLES